ncbi:MAG: fumarylacetoacetate hydrolase family protein [Bacteroidota bacterium]|nr:fumarylacetoacetate hydrolase family protein [Bacteroidota bacterium]
MKLIRFGEAGKEKPGVINNDGKIIDVSSAFHDYDESFFANDGLNKISDWLKQNEQTAPKLEYNVRIGAPIYKPGKIICIGLNYSDHAKESNMGLPKEPVVFFKASSALTGPNDNVIIPRGSKKTDWEVELAIVIGKKASYVSEAEALEYVAGYVLHNDLSEREFQLERSGQWVKGKSCDTFAPIGPFIATKDELQDVHNLRLWLTVNGEMMQDGNTKNLAFKVPFLVSYLSNFMSLLPGDIISTGTPAGVGLGKKPPRYLKAGDVVELGIDGLGSARQELKEYSENK